MRGRSERKDKDMAQGERRLRIGRRKGSGCRGREGGGQGEATRTWEAAGGRNQDAEERKDKKRKMNEKSKERRKKAEERGTRMRTGSERKSR